MPNYYHDPGLEARIARRERRAQNVIAAIAEITRGIQRGLPPTVTLSAAGRGRSYSATFVNRDIPSHPTPYRAGVLVSIEASGDGLNYIAVRGVEGWRGSVYLTEDRETLTPEEIRNLWGFAMVTLQQAQLFQKSAAEFYPR